MLVVMLWLLPRDPRGWPVPPRPGETERINIIFAVRGSRAPSGARRGPLRAAVLTLTGPPGEKVRSVRTCAAVQCCRFCCTAPQAARFNRHTQHAPGPGAITKKVATPLRAGKACR